MKDDMAGGAAVIAAMRAAALLELPVRVVAVVPAAEGDRPRAHLDGAGPAWATATGPYVAKGPTGSRVRTLVELARSTASL